MNYPNSVETYRENLHQELKEAGIEKFGVVVITGIDGGESIDCNTAASGSAVVCAQILWNALQNILLSVAPIKRSLLVIKMIEALATMENAPSERQP